MHTRQEAKIRLVAALIGLGVAGAFALPGSAPANSSGICDHSPPGSGGLAVAWVGSAQAEERGQPQQFCPITGEKIDKSVYLDHQGKRVYFCCDACKKAFLQDPEKVVKAIESKGVVLERSPAGTESTAPAQSGQGGHESHSGH